MHKFPSYLCRADLTEQAAGKGLPFPEQRQNKHICECWNGIFWGICAQVAPFIAELYQHVFFGSYAEVLKKSLWAGNELGFEASKIIICFDHSYYKKNWKYPNLLWSLNSIHKMKSY